MSGQVGAVPEAISRRGKVYLCLRIATISFVVFLGYKVVPFYYYYYDLKSSCARVLRNAELESDEELRRRLFEVVMRHGVRVEARDIRIHRLDGRIKIWMRYQEVLDLSLFGRSFPLYSFDFTPSAEGVFDE